MCAECELPYKTDKVEDSVLGLDIQLTVSSKAPYGGLRYAGVYLSLLKHTSITYTNRWLT